MFRIRWLGNVLQSSSSRKDRRRLVARNRKPIRLMLESLEQRLTPSGGNPTVTQTAGGYIALTSAVAADTAANTNYVIQLTGSFQFNSGGQVSISKLGSGSTLTIEGQNDTNYTLTGNGNRLFTIGSGQTVTFEDLTLTGGSVTTSKDAQGGAILDQGGNVTLSTVIVRGNIVKGGIAAGGGVYASGGGTLAIRDSLLTDNSAQGVQGASDKSGVPSGSALGGGVCLSGRGTLAILDSTLLDNSAQGVQGANGTAPGESGSVGGFAYGGGLYVLGSEWTVTLMGNTLSGNTAIGGNGGNGTAGSNATAPNTVGGNGGSGGSGGIAAGGAAYISVSYGGSGNLTILNDPSAPSSHPSLLMDNSAQGGDGGNGGAGGASTGTAADASGGVAGGGRQASGGALYVGENAFSTISISIANTTFFANKAAGGNDGALGTSGTGGQPNPPPPLPSKFVPVSGEATGGGLQLFAYTGTITMVNNTVAENTAVGGAGANGRQGLAEGGGIYDSDGFNAATVLDNNTITQNIIDGGGYLYLPQPPAGSNEPPTFVHSDGSGIFVGSASPNTALINNVIQNNRSINDPASDLDLSYGTLSLASNNFIATMSPNAVNTSTNIVGNTQVQLGNVVGIDSNGNPIGGPIYYPLLSGTVSIGAGSTSVLNTIAAVEETTPANATDEIGLPRSSNGSINLGAVQNVTPVSSYTLVLTYDPASQTAYAGSNVSFTASAGGHLPPTVQWQVSSDGGNTWSNISGATSTTLTLDNVTVGMSGNEYQAVFTNSSGSVTSAAAILTVNPVPPPPPPAPPPSPLSPPAPPVLDVPPLLAFLDSVFSGIETVNANGTETITDGLFGIPLIVSTFDAHGDLMSVDLFGFFNITFLFV
jgi:hypothetical protein